MRLKDSSQEVLFKDLLVTTKDGDWGKAEQAPGLIAYRVIRGTDFARAREGDLSSVPLRYLAESTVWRRTLQPFDILIETAGGTSDRPTGRTLLVTPEILEELGHPATCASFARFLRVDPYVADPAYVFWYLQDLYERDQMHQHEVRHTGVGRFQYTHFAESEKIRLPTLSAQRAIAATLGVIDQKIESNRRVVQNLDRLSRATFERQFAEFVTSGGDLPPGWKLGTFSDVVAQTISGDWGKDAPTGNYTKEVFCIRGADVPDVNVGNKGNMPVRYILPKNYDVKRLAPHDIVIEASGGSPTQSTGRCALITASLLERFDKDMVCTNFCKAIKPIEGYSTFIYFYWKYLYDQGVMFTFENGTTGVKNLDVSTFLTSAPVVIPPVGIASEFSRQIEPQLDLLFTVGRERERLLAVRDALLPELLSGRLRLPEAQETLVQVGA